jgi:hypothetical protein
MKKWLRRIRGAFGLGLAWGLTGFLAGMAIELVHNIWPNPLGSMVDIWPATLGFPGFVGGVAFSAVLGLVSRKGRFDELSIPRFAIWGAAGGLIVSLVPATMASIGLATPNVPLWQITLGLAGPFVSGGAIAASGTLAIARLSDDRELLDASRELTEVGLTSDEVSELLGDPGDSPQRDRVRGPHRE